MSRRLGELPSGLTELPTSGESKYRRRGDAIDRHLAASDLVGETEPGASAQSGRRSDRPLARATEAEINPSPATVASLRAATQGAHDPTLKQRHEHEDDSEPGEPVGDRDERRFRESHGRSVVRPSAARQLD